MEKLYKNVYTVIRFENYIKTKLKNKITGKKITRVGFLA